MNGIEKDRIQATAKELGIFESIIENTPEMEGKSFAQRTARYFEMQDMAAERERNLEEISTIGRAARRGINNWQASLYGFGGIAGQLLGAEGVKDWGIRGYKRNVREASLYPEEVSLEELWKDPSIGKAFTFGVETLGEVLPSMAEVAVGSIAGALAGSAVAPGPGTAAGAVGGALLKRTMLRKAISKLAGEMIEKGAVKAATISETKKLAEDLATKHVFRTLGSKAGVVGSVAPTEAGGNYGELVERGIDGDRAALSSLAFGTASAFLELAGGNARLINRVLGEKTAKAFREAIKIGDTHTVGRFLKAAAKQGGEEALQEMGQETLSMANIAVNDPSVRTDDVREPLAGLQKRARPGPSGGGLGGVFQGAMGRPSIPESMSIGNAVADAQEMERSIVTRSDISNHLDGEIPDDENRLWADYLFLGQLLRTRKDLPSDQKKRVMDRMDIIRNSIENLQGVEEQYQRQRRRVEGQGGPRSEAGQQKTEEIDDQAVIDEAMKPLPSDREGLDAELQYLDRVERTFPEGHPKRQAAEMRRGIIRQRLGDIDRGETEGRAAEEEEQAVEDDYRRMQRRSRPSSKIAEERRDLISRLEEFKRGVQVRLREGKELVPTGRTGAVQAPEPKANVAARAANLIRKADNLMKSREVELTVTGAKGKMTVDVNTPGSAQNDYLKGYIRELFQIAQDHPDLANHIYSQLGFELAALPAPARRAQTLGADAMQAEGEGFTARQPVKLVKQEPSYTEGKLPSAETKVFRRRRGQKTWESLTGEPEVIRDRQGTEGIHGAIGEGPKPGRAVSDTGTGAEAPQAGGVLQAQERIAPQQTLPVAPESVKTARISQQQPPGEAQAESPTQTSSEEKTALTRPTGWAKRSLADKVELWEITGIGSGKDKRTSPLLTFIRSKKGFKTGAVGSEGEVESLMFRQSGVKGLATKSGLHPDRMRELMVEEGLLDEDATLNDMWALVNRHMRGQTRGLSGENVTEFSRSEQEETERESQQKENALIRGQLIAKDLNYGDVIVTQAADGYDAYRVVEAGGDEIVLEDGMTIRMVPFDTVNEEIKGKIVDFYTGKEIDRKAFKELQRDLKGESGEKWAPDQTVMPKVGRPFRPYQGVLGGSEAEAPTDLPLSVGDEPPGSRGGMQHGELREALRPIASRWKRGPRIVTVQGREELPDHIRQAVESDNRRVRGVFDRENRTVYLIADGILDADEAQRVLFHEAVGHFGIREVMGDAIRPFLRQVVGMYGQRGLRSIADSYGFDLSTENGRLLAAEERLAQIAEANEQPRFLERVYAAIRNWLRRMGFTIRLNDGDVRAVLASARRTLEGRGGKSAGRFQEAPAYSVPVESMQANIDTPEFKRWFSGSKVIGPSGNPKVVYHATKSGGFEQFRPEKEVAFGYHFGNVQQANKMAEMQEYSMGFYDRDGMISPNIIPAYLSIKNPVRMKDYGFHSPLEILKQLKGKVRISTNEIDKIIDDYKEKRRKDKEEPVQWGFQKIRELLLNSGHDGIVYKNEIEGPGDSYIALDSTQIKSIWNQGTFDPDNPNISLSAVADRIADSARSVTGTLSAAKFHRNYGIKLPVKYTKDLKKGFRHVQTMQDLARNYPEMKRLLDKQLKRESETSRMSAHDRETTDPYFLLDKKSRKRVNRALLDGDRGFLVFDDKVLKDLYNLNPYETVAYKAVRNVLDEKLDMLLEPMVDHALVETELTPDDKKALIAEIKSSKDDPESLGAKLARFELTEQEAGRMSWMARWIAEHEGYVPHKWNSDWVVRVSVPSKKEGEEDTVYLLEVNSLGAKAGLTHAMRERAAHDDAVRTIQQRFGWTPARIKALSEQGKIVVRHRTDLPVELFQGARKDVMESIIETATEKAFAEYTQGMSEDQKKTIGDLQKRIKESLEELYLAKGWGQHLIGRKGVLGYREDLENVIPEYLQGFNAFITKGNAAREFAETMKEIDPTETPEMWKHGKEFVSDMLGESSEAGWYKKFMGLYFLGGDVSAAALNMTQNWTHAVNVLRGIPGRGPAEKDIARAMTDVMKEYAASKRAGRRIFSEPGAIKADELDAMKQAYERGILDAALMGEVTGFHSNRIWSGYVTDKLWGGLFKMFTGSEAWNRASTFLAAYRRAKAAGVEDPVGTAGNVVQTAHFIYGRGNRPQIVRKLGAVGNITYTFMTYPWSNLVFLKHRVQDLLDAKSPAEKRVAMKVIGGNLAYLFAFGGAVGMPFSEFGIPIARAIWNLFLDDEDDLEVAFRKHFPKPVGRTVARGLPAVFGNDFSWRVQGTDVLGMPIGWELIQTMARRGKKAAQLWQEDEKWGAAFHLAPDMFRNPFQAVVGFKEGGERRGVPPVKYTTGEAVTRGLGFTPTREAETYHAVQVTKEKREDRLETLEAFAERFIRARKEGGEKGKKLMGALQRDWQQYNRKERKKGKSGVLIAWTDIMKSARLRTRSRGKGYVERVPKYLRRYQEQTMGAMGLDQ